ncbi:hypothetical protein MED297_11255 [Reinekea sp. MED297]|uniref:Uncharacterized protein n=1 Tax=Reinekea blandensis MED297 TaxID=314283 RepID=A4BAX6_9GAMM|nr:hypothetical protein MED297_11255 [Reinekea sp. MED297] [Reinekea blandensis MED297]
MGVPKPNFKNEPMPKPAQSRQRFGESEPKNTGIELE